MAEAVWKAEVTVDAPTIVGPAPGGVNFPPVGASRLLIATDANGQEYGIEARLDHHSYGPGPTLEFVSTYYAVARYIFTTGIYWYNNVGLDYLEDPITMLPLTIVEADGNNGASFLAGGQLSITKDFNANTLTFGTPLGNIVIPLDRVTPTVPGPLMASGMGHGMAYGADVDTSELTLWHDFRTLRNGVNFAGWALSAADPGFWSLAGFIPGNQEVLGTGYALGGTSMPTIDVQLLARYQTEFFHTAGAADDSSVEVRFATTGTAGGFSLDMTTWHELGAAVGVYMPSIAMMSIVARRSQDDGVSWTDSMAFIGADELASLSVQVVGGTIVIVFFDVTTSTTYQIVSRDAGASWSIPVPVPIVGTNPRLVVSPESACFYFSIDGGGRIVLQRSFDGGQTLADPTPLTVASGVPSQDFGAVMVADRTLLVAYMDAGNNWVTRQSRDWGATWNTS
jgi:hypothetical protein